jgi:imidazolonepropionase-like amidohydrolase
MRLRGSSFLTVGLLGLTVITWISAGETGETFIIKGAKVFTSGTRGVLENAALLIEEGKIIKIIQGEVLPSLPVKDYSGRCIMPGLVDAHSYVSGYYRLLENTEAITSDLVARAAFDPASPEVKSALEAGITTVNFSPRSENLVGGVSSILKLSSSLGDPSSLRPRAFLKISFNGEALRPDRAPTSLMGAEAMLGDTLGAIKAGLKGNREAVFRQAGLLALLDGDLVPMVAASTLAEVNTALKWLDAWNMRGVIVGGEEAHLLSGPLKERGTAILLSPILPSYPEKAARNACLLTKQGIKTAFVSHMPEADPWSLRFSALMLCSQGISEEEALKVITIFPAEILGVAASVGSLEEGKDADLVVLSGEPLDLSSEVVAVYVNGRAVLEKGKIGP